MIEGISLLWLWAILVSAIIAIFRIMEDTATPDAKRKVADWIKSMAAKSISQTVVESPRWFVEAFDRIFGVVYQNFPRVSRSCVASVLAVFVMTIVWAILDPSSWQRFLSSGGKFPIFNSFITLLIFNLVPDYFSLMETRWILRRAARAGVKKLIMLLVLDVIITGGLFFCGDGLIGLRFCVVSGEWEGMVELVSGMLEFLIGCILMVHEPLYIPPFGIFFYSTYFTSVWFYLFIASSLATKLLFSLGHIGNRVLALLKVEEKPFQSMGLIVVGLLTLVFAISAIIGAIG